ncbi:anti-sigma factor domain-containing protein [Congregicoccus parvus]|uniref:anti-sigma factor domain-containing protein n=1 Tax=Congregicoccus parvus TaxID=3081749 RepID=UPI003FA5CE3D
MDEHKQERACAYVLGHLDETDRRAFEREMEGDDALRAFVRELVDALGATAQSLPQPVVGDALRDRVMADVERASASVLHPSSDGRLPKNAERDDRSKETRSGGGAFVAWSGWAVAAVLAVTAFVLVRDRARLADERLRSTRALEEMEMRSAAAEQERDEGRELLEQVREELVRARSAADLAEMRVARLESQVEGQAEVVAVSLWSDAGQQGVLVVENLRLPPPGKTYQLWVLDPSTQAPIDAGIFTTDEEGRGRIVFRPKSNVQTAAQFAISVENEGGVAAPQGPIVMLGATSAL